MAEEGCTRNGRRDGGDGEVGAGKNLWAEPALGDLIWVKLEGDSWWPGVIVDENAVPENKQPHHIKAIGDVLIRLYGSYQYLYVDPSKYRSEFEIILKQNNGSPAEVLRKSVEQDLRCIKSGGLKRKGSVSKVTMQNGVKKKHKEDSSSSGEAQKQSTRRFKVMQTLGLTAPFGSPYCKNGRIFSESAM